MPERHLVVPALYNLAASDLLPEKFCLVGIARKGLTSDRLRDSLMKGLREFATRPVDDAIAQRLLSCVTCIEADPKDPASFDAMSIQAFEPGFFGGSLWPPKPARIADRIFSAKVWSLRERKRA